MRFHVLGPLSITDGRETVMLQPSKPTILLATVLLYANSVVAVGHLQRTIWGEQQPNTAKAALQTCVLRLRRLFGKYGMYETPIEAVPGGYRITADEHTLDLLGFRERVRAARELSGVDDGEAELYALKTALALWQGSLLANVPSEVLHRDEVPWLQEERLRTVERVADLQLGLGRCGEVPVELWGVTRMFPGHERFREQLIEALYRTGRQSEALAEYRRVKAYLLEEFGVDPSPSLQKLELAILRGEDLGGTGDAGSAQLVRLAPPGTEPAPRAVEPAPRDRYTEPDPADGAVSEVTEVPAFTGRQEQVAALLAWLAEGAGDGPALLTGAPGVGKTALASHVAQRARERHPGGTLLVRMVRADGTPRDPAALVREVRAVLDARAARTSLTSAARTLLLLDDVVDAEQARALLATVSDGTALVTSRRSLSGLVATHGGWVSRIGTFTDQESYELLRAALGDARVVAEPEAAHALAAHCGRHPLALRILTARLLTRPGLGLADAVGWLAEEPFARLSLPDDPRMSVRHVLEGALDRIGPELAGAFTHLAGLPANGFLAADVRRRPGRPEAGVTADTGTGTGTGTDADERVLEQLADAGLLEEGSPGPYRMHDLLRGYARWATDRTGTRQEV
ncbi:BTAD domain-containing putative transcriptional regulator [Streptomyces oceani]|uniref:AfsR family transcriptional regulator n=1 Tax=Streptomyces oceani TaxID=1075402 RepID=A0A1E7KJK6_9ACTN|nr:BTAD domain-containing putative transcriptional regulator [Streptomyces oceani]OEV04095.1 AfsR family transcriptional regulator [Streptomyces oceani]